jgi:hypothetical protein
MRMRNGAMWGSHMTWLLSFDPNTLLSVSCGVAIDCSKYVTSNS